MFILCVIVAAINVGGDTGAVSDGAAGHRTLLLHLVLQIVFLLCALSGQLQRQLRHRRPCAGRHEPRCSSDGLHAAQG